MPKKMKIEFTDDEGSKYSLSIEGPLSKEKMHKLIEVYEFLGGEKEEEKVELDTIFSKVTALIEEEFPASNFTTANLQEAYENKYNQPIKLTTLSTYLNRLVDQRMLKRVRIGTGYIYRKITLSSNFFTTKNRSTLARQ
ncbi:MAG: hypothetical protein ACK4TI_01055 [Nitrososphaerales archaeon]